VLPPSDNPKPRWGRQTIIICPGSRGGRTAYFTLAREFLEQGYNVLTFDFRGHGESDGQIDSFGDHERRDVLGAVRWLRENHPIAGGRIVALGVDTGGAALLAAADDPSPEGKAIDAMAVFGCYDRFDKLAAGASALQWVIGPISLPLACVQTGADLWDFSPARAAADIAPRPILFVHGLRDPVITFERGQELYEAASAPKSHIWLDDLTDEQAVDDPEIIARARHFLDTAIPML
jgi:alpha-beta hydrolase superfamily lysophospholipase